MDVCPRFVRGAHSGADRDIDDRGTGSSLCSFSTAFAGPSGSSSICCSFSRPLFALLAGSHPPARDFWTEFAVALGYSGLAMMGLQFGLTARFRYVTEPWGEDVIYHFHRQISLTAVGLIVAHPLILFAVQPELRAPSNFIGAPLSAVFRRRCRFSR